MLLEVEACQHFFCFFKHSDPDVDNLSVKGRPWTFEDTGWEALVEKDRCQTLKEIASAQGISCWTTFKWMRALVVI